MPWGERGVTSRARKSPSAYAYPDASELTTATAGPRELRHSLDAANKATLIDRRTKNLRAVQLLLGHSKLESTVRYLGIEIDDALRDLRADGDLSREQGSRLVGDPQQQVGRPVRMPRRSLIGRWRRGEWSDPGLTVSFPALCQVRPSGQNVSFEVGGRRTWID